ncbi:ABC transporter ATP-binding protein [Amycolatopsis jejuensis]|uniref:ABC transporter ATP-binding protein n=1 Tax=Amycolatopsis jejuensis TaxID=330084 RepID=UPI0005243E27|nr:ABC transporter ATP-binding protein [Amycolatopsis jejuensis]
MTTTNSAPRIACAGLDLVIAGNRILSGVSLAAAPGEFLGVIGSNGAGKTCLINVLSGAMTPTAGSVRFDGNEIRKWPPHRRARAGLGRTFQTSTLFLGRTVLENVRLAGSSRTTGFLAALPPVRRSDPGIGDAREALGAVGLSDRAEEKADALSHGERRKLELAMVIAQGATCLLLDEPMAGVNSADIHDLVEVIRALHATQGLTIVMVEHHMDVVLDLAERVAVMHHGELLAVDTPEGITANETVQSAYIGESL